MKCMQCGSELTTGDGIDRICQACKCKNEQKPVLTGWICPRCGVAHSPFVTECNCPPPVKVWYGTTSDYPEKQ